MNEYSLPLSAAGAARVNDNPYARSVDEIAQEAERRRQREAVTRATENPDQAAEARRIARQAGVPAPLVQSKLPDYRADQRRSEVAQAARDPRVGPWLAQNAEVAGDDIATLINLGQTGERFKLAQDGARSRFTFSRRELIDENFRPQELTKPQRDILRASSRSRAEYRSLVADAVMAKRAPASAAAQAAADDERDKWEKMQRGPIAQIGGSLGAGVFNFAGGMYGLAGNVAALAGAEDAESGLLFVQGLADKQAASMRGRSTNFVTDSLLMGLESVPVSLGTVATGSVKAGLGLFFAQTSGNSYAEARGHGLGVLRSTLYGTTQGGIEVATEALPAKALGDLARGNGSISGALKRFFVGDVLGEQAATFLQDANSWVTLNPDKTLAEFAAERPEAAARTFFATLSGSGTQAAVAYGLHRAFRTERQIVESEGQLSQLDALMKAAAESKTRGRDPEAFRELIEQVAGDGRLMVPGEVIASFNQSYRDDPFWRDYADEIDEAVATGGEVSIPLADAAARLAGTPDWDAVGPSARIGAEGMSRTEIDEANAALGSLDREAADEAEAQIRADNRAAAPGVKLRENIRSQLMNAGMTPDVASQNAEIVAALFETEAANLGRKITGDEFGEAISVQRELPGLIGKPEALDQLDIVVNAMRAGGDVEVGVGPSLLQFIAQQGGINDTGGDLKSMGLPKRMIRDFDPAQSTMLGLSGAGEYGIDNVYRAAIEAGYFPDLVGVSEQEGVDTLDTNDFLAAISDELAGRKRFSQVREESYRRAGQELRAILDAAGVDADTASIEEIRAAVTLFEEGQTFDQAESVLQETSEGKPLVTVHNLSAENFRNAEELGGLAAPSIAVVRADIGFDNFGEITLIAKPDLIDPKKGKGAKAFNADVYSPRQPRAQFDLYGPTLKKLREDMDPIAKELGESFDSEFDTDKLAREGLAAIEQSAVARLAFLRSIGQNVKPVRSEKPKADPRLVKLAKAKGINSWQDLMLSKGFEAAAVEVELELERIVDAEAGERSPEVQRRIRMRTFEFDDAGEIVGLTDFALRDAARSAFGATQPAPIDRYATRRAIENKVKSSQKREAEFRRWVQENYAGLIYGRFFEARDSGRRREYTMENLVREMTRTIRDGEGYNYGIGSLRSNVAKQFRTLAEIKADRDYIISEKEMDKIKEEASNEMFAILDKFRPYHRSGQDYGFTDIFTDFLKDLAANRIREWQSTIFAKPVPDDLLTEAREFLSKLRGLPTEYFEVKMQRAVGIEEFAAAAIPSDLDAETRARLKSYGLKLATYERGGPRSEAIMKAARAADARILFQNGAGPNAQIQFTDALAIIKLFETANLTSFQHEMAHFWLERFKGNALAALETDGNPAARSTFADWETLKAWFAENGHAVGDDNVIPTEAHELFARSWERYLMEGKAPKTSLNSVFRKVANWFKSIYRSVKALNAPITPEVREVMDRMLATEEEIAAAAQDRAMMLMFDDAVAAGMSEAEAMRYRALGDEARNEAEEELYGKVMKSIRARETKAWKAQARVIRMDVQDMVENRPVFQALGMLRGEYRLDRDWLVYTYGEDALKLLPAGVPPIYRERGDNADQIAEMVGFKSGDEMVRELMGLERLRQQMKASGDKRSVKKATIDQEVAEEMHRRFGDPLTDGSIEREAAAAIQNERQGERIEMELRALASKANRKPTPYALAREWAKGRIARGVVAETVSGDAQYRYTRTATKAAKAATAAFIKGDTAEAFKQKQIEMLHNALAREAAEQGDRIERAVKRMGKLAKQRTVKTLAQDYLDQIHGLLENYEFKQVSQRQINARDAYAAWAAEQAAAGKGVVAVERLAQAKNWSRMTVEELIALDDAVKGLVHLGKLKRTLLDNKARRDLDAVVGEALSVMATLPQKERRQMDGGEGWVDAVGKGFLSLNAALRKMEDIFDRLDGIKRKNMTGVAKGVFNRIVMAPLVEAQARERELLDTKVAEVVAAMKEVPKESLKRWQDKRMIDELAAMDEQGRPLPEPATMLGEELIAMALNMGNRGNMEKLIAGRGWDKQHGSMDAARAVVLEVLDRELTPADWQYVQRVWDIVDSLWPELSAMEKRVNGFAPDKVEAESFWVGRGIDAVKLRGGYFPVVYDPRSNVGARNLEVEENGLFPSSYYRATTRAGSTRERTEFKGPLHLSLSALNRHLAEVVHDITHREAIINADKFLSDPRVKQGVIDVVGTEIEKQFRPWLQHIANEWAADREANSQAERMLKGLRTNATMVGLGFRISTIMLQVSGYAGSIERVGLTPIVRGIIKSRWSPEAWSFALDNSKELRSRMATMDRDIRDNARKLASKQAGVLDAAQQFAFHGIGYMDRLVTVATWHGAYDKALADGQTHDDAVFFADKMVRQSQGSGAAKDMARVQRGTGKMGEAWKLASMFYSYSSAFYQRQAAFANDTADAVRERDLAAVPDLAARFLWLNIVPALASAWLSGNGPGEDEDEGAWALAQILKGAFQGIPIARDIAGALESGFGYSFTPAEGFGRSVVNLWNDGARVVEGEETKRMTRNFLETIGYATGKVPGQLATSTQFLVDVGYGEQDPQTAAEWWRGITKGKAVAEN